ncbi:CLUMA_CG012565, isoform B [Clunio marinus]|nr:CLUMA_CG012565, isoform B [Clunio marinus]
MKSALFLFILSVTSTALARPPTFESEEYTDNNLVDTIPEEIHEDERTEHVSITSAPKKDIYFPSEPIEAECRVTGMPVPVVEWVHGTGSINNNDFEMNTIIDQSPSGIATVVARLIIKPHHVKPGTTRTFTCVGKSGAKVVKASTTVHFSHESKQPDIISALVGSEKIKIYEFYENLFEYIGSNVVLPCKATTKAEIYWINDDGKLITGQEPRLKVLETGELLITNLRFGDMGTYICLAKNNVSKDVASTFLYPLANKK